MTGLSDLVPVGSNYSLGQSTDDEGRRTPNSGGSDALLSFTSVSANHSSTLNLSQTTSAPGNKAPDGAVNTATADALVDLINPGTSTGNTFITDSVDGASTTVLKFPTNNGLVLSPTTGVIPNDVYTIAILFKFDEVNKVRRILDFKNGASNSGLYATADNKLRFNPNAVGSVSPLSAGVYMQVVLSRDAAGVVTGYVNGAQQFQFTDTNNDAVIDSNNILRYLGQSVWRKHRRSIGRIDRAIAFIWPRASGNGDYRAGSRAEQREIQRRELQRQRRCRIHYHHCHSRRRHVVACHS